MTDEQTPLAELAERITTTHLSLPEMRAIVTAHLAPLYAELEWLRLYRARMEEAHGERLYAIEKLLDHFDDEGNLKGDGQWRIREIWQCCKAFDEGSEKAAKLSGESLLAALERSWEALKKQKPELLNDLPELTDAMKARMNAMPSDLVHQLWTKSELAMAICEATFPEPDLDSPLLQSCKPAFDKIHAELVEKRLPGITSLLAPLFAELERLRDAVGKLKLLLAIADTDECKTAFVCKATAGTDPPQDCDWPCCGCDPYANQVIESLGERNLELVPKAELTALRTLLGECREIVAGGVHDYMNSVPEKQACRDLLANIDKAIGGQDEPR